MEKFKRRVLETESKLLGLATIKDLDSLDLKARNNYCGLDLEKALDNSLVLDNLHDERICV